MKKLLMLSVAIATISVATVSMAELPLPGPQHEELQPLAAQEACELNCIATKQGPEILQCFFTECGVEKNVDRGTFNPNLK